MTNQNDLIGKRFVFDDGNVIEVVQVKNREVDNETHPWVTYHIYQGNSLPRKLVMKQDEFINTFGHLFENK
jgi:hypothetical protein